MRGREQVVVVLVAMTAALAACGDDDGKRYSDAKIVDKLNLEHVEGQKDYVMKDDLFCTVDRRLLNTSSEVEEAVDEADINLVVASREGNVGIVGVPIFADDCRDVARKKLNRLDPKPAD